MLIYERSVASNQASIMERAPGSMLDTTMRLLMRKNSVYIAFIFTGAIIGERVVDYGINKVWERNNTGVGLYLESFYSDTLFFRLQFLVFAF